MEMSKLVSIVKENAVCSITFYNDEGQVVSYLTRAIKINIWNYIGKVLKEMIKLSLFRKIIIIKFKIVC